MINCTEINCWDCGANIVLDQEPYNLVVSKQPKINKEKDMYAQCTSYPVAAMAYAQAVTPTTMEHTQRAELSASAAHERDEKLHELKQHFGLIDQDPPHNASELIERIKAGDYSFDKDYTPEQAYNWGYGMTWGLKWRKPDTKFDVDGFEVAEKKLKTEYSHLQQDVLILPLEKALASVRAFESKTFH